VKPPIFRKKFQRSQFIILKNWNKSGRSISLSIKYLCRAISLRDNTPYSFKELEDLKLIFSNDFLSLSKETLIAQLEKIENLPCLPMMPEELFFYSYPDILSCSNPQCKNSLNAVRMS
jgi:hypothetical protein